MTVMPMFKAFSYRLTCCRSPGEVNGIEALRIYSSAVLVCNDFLVDFL
jgi:hypothetical protein